MAIKTLKDEKKLIVEIAHGNEQAFTTLFYHYLPVLERFALRFTRSEQATEEIIQDTFMKIWLNRDKLLEVENVQAYLYKYVSNECLSFLRNQMKKNQQKDKIKIRSLTERNTTTQDTLNLNEVTRLINQAADQLSPQRKVIYKLSRVDGLNMDEIAHELGISKNTVKNALVISLKQIRTHLSNNGVALSFFLLLKI